MGTTDRWKSDQWAQRRADFLAEGVSAPKILEFRRTNNSFDVEVEATRRDLCVQHLAATAGLGKDDSPKGRQLAYMDAVAPFDYKDKPRLDNRNTFIGHCPAASSCGLLIRAAWQLFGAGDMSLFAADPPDPKRVDSRLRQAYDQADVFQEIAQWAYNCGALHGHYIGLTGKNIEGPKVTLDDANHWKAGDVLFVTNSPGKQHIFTIVKSTPQPAKGGATNGTWSVDSVDGGKGMFGADEDCMGIQKTNRSCYVLDNQLNFKLNKIDYPVVWWADFAKVKFTDPEYFFARRGIDHPDFGK